MFQRKPKDAPNCKLSIEILMDEWTFKKNAQMPKILWWLHSQKFQTHLLYFRVEWAHKSPLFRSISSRGANESERSASWARPRRRMKAKLPLLATARQMNLSSCRRQSRRKQPQTGWHGRYWWRRWEESQEEAVQESAEAERQFCVGGGVEAVRVGGAGWQRWWWS